MVASNGAGVTVSAAMGSPVGSPGPPCRAVVTGARIAASTSSRPVRVGFTPTRRTVTRASGTIRPATSRNAADEMSPGTCTAAPLSGPGCSVTVRVSGRSSRAPNARSITSLWSREGAGSRTVTGPSARSPARRIADFTCAEAIGVV